MSSEHEEAIRTTLDGIRRCADRIAGMNPSLTEFFMPDGRHFFTIHSNRFEDIWGLACKAEAPIVESVKRINNTRSQIHLDIQRFRKSLRKRGRS